MKTKVLIADDHSVVRSGLKLVLESSGAFEIVAEAADGGELLGLVEIHAPELVIVDISMPVVNGIDAVRALRARYPEMKILAMTVHADEEYIFQMLKAGANGYLLKSAGKDEIFHAAASVLSGATFFSPTVSDIVIQGFIERAGAESRPQAAAMPGAPPDALPLTRRETEVLRLIAQGMTNREIGETLFISVRTVNTHRTNLMQKLDLHDTAGLVRCAIAHGLLSQETGVEGSE
jgi:DNA-binding NarL/FixJ family response regulator